MKDVRVPGVIWAIALIVVVALIHENDAYLQASFGLSPFFLDMIVTVAIAILKSISLGTEQLNQALDIIDAILRRDPQPPDGLMRSAGVPVPESVAGEPIPERPNPVVRWLLG